MSKKQNRRVMGAQSQKQPQKKKKDEEKFTKLKSLPYFDEIRDKIVAGVALEEVARWIQEDMLGYVDAKRDSLVRQLFRYKASLPPGELVREPPLHIRKRIEKLKHGVNEIEELEKLYLLQLTRVNMDVQTEEKINKLFGGTSREIQLAADLLNRMLEKKMSLGILSKSPERFEFSGDLSALTASLDGREDGNSEVDEDQMTRLGLAASKLVDTIAKAKDNGEDQDAQENEKD